MLKDLVAIHGRPYQTWGDAPGLPNKIGKAGYCPHDNELFLGWHRPYLALFEVSISFLLLRQHFSVGVWS